MDARACVLLFVLGVSCVAAQTTPAGQTEVAWWGKMKPWNPHYKPTIYKPLVLTSEDWMSNWGAEAGKGTKVDVKCKITDEVVGTAGIVAFELEDKSTVVTGAGVAGEVKESNVLITFKLTKSCCGYGEEGTISVVGREVGEGDTETYTIVGGTKKYCFINGGILTVTKKGGYLTYTFHFYYNKN